MSKKGLNDLAIFSLSLAILTDCIALFIAIKLQKINQQEDQQKKQSDEKIKTEIQELQNELLLLKREMKKHKL